MVALIVGIVMLALTAFSVLPAGLGWGPDVLLFLRGCAPCLVGLIGLVAVFIGIADVRDKLEAKKEEAEAKSDSKE